MLRKPYLLLWQAFFILLTLSASAFSPLTKPEDLLKVTFLPAQNAKAGEVIETRLQVEISKGWHIFSEKPELKGVTPLKIELEDSNNFSLQKIVFPKPSSSRLEVFDKTLTFYQDKIVIGVLLKLKQGISGDFPVEGTLTFQGCSNSVCLRPSKVEFEGVQLIHQAGEGGALS